MIVDTDLVLQDIAKERYKSESYVCRRIQAYNVGFR